jgi:membrane protein implicated in regulation of membrane protease activity
MTLRLVLRYAAFQLPGLAIVGCVLFLVRQWDLLSAGTAGLIFFLWIAKDVLMFPIARSAYLPEDEGSSPETLGAVGVARDGLVEDAYVRIGPELWRARRVSGSPPITPGQRFRVVALDGLTVLVESHQVEEDR